MFLLSAITVTAFLVALFGLVQYLTWNGRIYWFRRVPATSSFGPFVNHNHFAGYVGMVIPIAICFGFFFMESRGREDDHSAPDRLGRLGLAFFAAVLLVVSLVFTLSRGGILSTVIGGIVLFWLVSRRMVSRLATWSVAILLALVAVALIVWIGADILRHEAGAIKKFENEATFESRVVIWRTMLEHDHDFRWFGSGLGTFEESFAAFTPPGSSQRWDRAHNDYLQLLWETGLVGFALFLVAAAIFVRRYWWPAVRARSHPLSLFRLGLAISVLTIALHSVVDFNLQIGSNGFLFALICGSLVALDDRSKVELQDPGDTLRPSGSRPIG
jgi:O-antigen ligase